MPTFFRIRTFSVLLLLFPFFLLHGQTLPPPVSSFTSEEFGGHPQVFCAEALSDGRMVFGNGSKVLLYDGEGFQGVQVGEGKLVYSIDSDPQGRIFVGGTSLMGVILPNSKGSLSYHSLTSLLPDSLQDFGTIWNTYSDGDGNVYFDALDHLFEYDGDSLRPIEPSQRFFLMHDLPGRGLYVQEEQKGLLPLEDGRGTPLPRSDSVFKDLRVMSIVRTPSSEGEGEKWAVFTRTKGAFLYDPSNGRREASLLQKGKEGELSGKKIYDAVRVDADKNPYGAAYVVGTVLDGIHLLGPEGHHILEIGEKEGLPAKGIWQLVADDRGNVWAGTENGIGFINMGTPATMIGKWVWREQERKFEQLPHPNGQCNDMLHFPIENGKDRLFIAASTEGLLACSAPFESAKRSDAIDTLSHAHSYALKRAPFPGKGSVLEAGRTGMRVFVPNGGKEEGWERILSIGSVPDGIISIAFDSFEEEPDSIRIWGTMRSKGAIAPTVDTAFTGYRSFHYDSSYGLPKGEIRVFQEPHGKRVLFATAKGIFRFDGTRFQHEGRFGDHYTVGERATTFIKEGVGKEVWLEDEKGGRIRRFIPRENGYRIDSSIFRYLDIGVTRSLLCEPSHTWIGGDRGLASYHPDVEGELDKEWHCRIRSVRGADDTLLFAGEHLKKASESKEGAMGALRVSNERTIPYVRANEQPSSKVPVLPYSKNRMKFVFAALYPDRQDAVEYSYKLEGFDTTWSKWTKENKKEYTNLPEGSYELKVRARNIYLRRSDTASYRFRISPPWFRTWTAYGGYGILSIGLVWFLIRLNTRRLALQKERLEKLVRERTREIQEKNQELRSANEAIQREKEEVEKKNRALEEANETIHQQKEEVEEAHREITQSIDYAKKIQQALLQSEEHVSPNLPGHFIYFKPQSQVSGDLYWGKEHQGYFYIAAVDCTGHGVPGAFMSMLGISQLNEIMNTDDAPTPGEILTELRERVVKELSGADPDSTAKDGMDAALLKIPIPSSQTPSGEAIEVQFAGAQNPLYVVRKGIAEKDLKGLGQLGERIKPFKKSPDGIEIKGDHMPVGYDEYAKGSFTTATLQLQKGDMLYIFSDGYADQFGGPKRKKFRYNPFKELLIALSDLPLVEQKKELDRVFEEWKKEGQQEQIDDVVVVGIRL